MKGHTALMQGQQKINDTLRKVFYPTTDTLKFLTVSETEDEFDEFFEIETGWLPEYDVLRRSVRLEIADTSDDLTETLRNCTHFRIGDDTYVIREGDTIPPKGMSVTWLVFGDLKPTRGNYVEMW
jgi:hypothetical protein